MSASQGSMWNRSERDTASLRETLDCVPDACVYRKGELVALVFCDGRKESAWHLYLAVHGGARPPGLEELLEAREVLLPNIQDLAITPCQGLGIPVLHLAELREGWGMRLQ